MNRSYFAVLAVFVGSIITFLLPDLHYGKQILLKLRLLLDNS